MEIAALYSYPKNLPSKHNEVFEREMQPHEMVKYLCEMCPVTPNFLFV